MGAGVLFVVLTFYAAMSQVPWLFLLALWVLAILPVAFVYAAWNRRGLTLKLAVRAGERAAGSPADDLPEAVLRRSTQVPPVFEGDGLSVQIAFRARRAPRGPVWAAGQIAGSTFRVGTGAVTRDGWSGVTPDRAATRGEVRASGWVIGTSDPFGFFRGLRTVPEAELALILPTFASLANRHQARELEASVAAPRAGAGNELFGIREYRPGDSLRRIHWRSSARVGELVVREFEPPGTPTLTILVDPKPPTAATADQVARIAASEAWDCLREGGRVALTGGIETRDVWEVLEWLARYPQGADDAGDGRFQRCIVVTTHPALMRHDAVRNWLVGDAPVNTDVTFERVGTTWPL